MQHHHTQPILCGPFGELLLHPDTRGKCAPHFHVTHAIGVAVAGGGSLFALGKLWTYRARMVVVTNPYDTHWGRPSAGGLDYYLFNPAPDWLKNLGALRHSPDADWFSRAVYDDPALADELASAFQSLEATGADDLLASALDRLFGKYASHRRSDRGAVPSKRKVDLDPGTTITGLAKRAGLSRAHFSRDYRRAEGLSPMHHRRQLRVLAARSMIENGSSLADAALEAGFSDQAHMTRQFRQILGMTPSAYMPLP